MGSSTCTSLPEWIRSREAHRLKQRGELSPALASTIEVTFESAFARDVRESTNGRRSNSAAADTHAVASSSFTRQSASSSRGGREELCEGTLRPPRRDGEETAGTLMHQCRQWDATSVDPIIQLEDRRPVDGRSGKSAKPLLDLKRFTCGGCDWHENIRYATVENMRRDSTEASRTRSKRYTAPLSSQVFPALASLEL